MENLIFNLIGILNPILLAGLPNASLSGLSVHLTELTLLILAGAFAGAFVVQGVWNGLKSEFPRLPKLSYYRALMVVLGVSLAIRLLFGIGSLIL